MLTRFLCTAPILLAVCLGAAAIPIPRTVDPSFKPPLPSSACGVLEIYVVYPGLPVEGHLVVEGPCSNRPLVIEPDATLYQPARDQTTYSFHINLCEFCPDSCLTLYATLYPNSVPVSTSPVHLYNDPSCCEPL